MAAILFGSGVVELALPFGGGVFLESLELGGRVVGQAPFFGGLGVVTAPIVLGRLGELVGQPASALVRRPRCV